MNETREPALAAFDEIRSCLEATRDRICSDISHYPTPIPGCDVDFNRLLEERASVFQELARLDRLRGELTVTALERFVAQTQAITTEDRSKLAAAVHAALDGASA